MKYFKISEFDSPDSPGSGSNMDEEFLRILDDIREDCGFPFIINSGFRTPTHNEEVGGKPSSAHLSGLAVDIKTSSRKNQLIILIESIYKGIDRFGLATNGSYIHIDYNKDLPHPALWYY